MATVSRQICDSCESAFIDEILADFGEDEDIHEFILDMAEMLGSDIPDHSCVRVDYPEYECVCTCFRR